MSEENKKITKEYVIEYLDSSCDGGMMYSFVDGKAMLQDASPKALKMLGYDSMEEIRAQGGLCLSDCVEINSNIQKKQDMYGRFRAGLLNAVRLEMVLTNRHEKKLYGEIFCYRARHIGAPDGQELIIAEIRLRSVYDTIFMESKKLLDEMSLGFVILKQRANQDFSIIYANKGFSDMLHLSMAEIIDSHGDNFLEYVYQTDYKNIAEVLQVTVEKGNVSKNSYRLVTKTGSQVWVQGSHQRMIIGEDTFVYISYTDIRELMGTQISLEKENVKLTEMVNSMPIGLAIFSITDQGETNTLAINQRLVELSNEMGKTLDGKERNWTKEMMSQLFNENIYAFAVSEDIPSVQQMLKAAKENGTSTCIFRLRGSVGENTIWVSSACSYKKDEKEQNIYYVTFQNVTTDKRNEEELRESHDILLRISYQDALTGVHNRAAYNELIEKAKVTPLQSVGVAFADLNGLKNVNDTLGHRQGDAVILDFIQILKTRFSPEQIYRISGDEFVIVAEEMSERVFKAHVRAIIESIKNADDIASIGYIWSEKIANLKQVVHRGEELMYIEKQKYYANYTARESKHRPKLLNMLLEDLAQGSYQMYLQPKAHIHDMDVIGAEALVRKFDAEGNIVFPDNFIPQLEREKLISRVDFFMLEEVCKLLEKWKKEQKKEIKVSVNMSRISLAEENYMEHVLAICNRYEVNHEQIEFEITESTETMDHNRLVEEVAAMKAAGFGVSLDDMGTDYSSLKMLPIKGIDTVKLDRSFILQMDDEQGRTIIQHVIELCHDLGMICIAEGVEDLRQRKELQEMGCDMYQGYLLARPIPVIEFEKLLASE